MRKLLKQDMALIHIALEVYYQLKEKKAQPPQKTPKDSTAGRPREPLNAVTVFDDPIHCQEIGFFTSVSQASSFVSHFCCH